MNQAHAQRVLAHQTELANAVRQPARTFRLRQQQTVFRLVRSYQAAGFIPSVVGHTLDGTLETVAREADIEWLS